MTTHNFFFQRCEVQGGDIYLVGCQRRLDLIDAGDPRAEAFNDCAAARKRGACPTATKLAEETASFPPSLIYYVDRDDAGPGVMSRRDLGLPERSEAEKVAHHKILKALGREPYDPNRQPEPQKIDKTKLDGVRRPGKAAAIAAAKDTKIPRWVEPAAGAKPVETSSGAFDLGSLITDAVKELKQ